MAKRSSIVVVSLFHLVLLVAAQTLPPPAVAPAMSPTTPLSPAPAPRPPTRIDTHTHFVPPFYKALLDSRNITSGGRPIPHWNASAHLATNARFGIVTSIVSISTPGAVLSANAPIEEGRTLARQLNEFGFKLTTQYPKNFLYFATLTLPDLDGAVAEAIYALDTLGAAGVILEANAYGELLGTPRYAPLYKVLDDRQATVFVHPSESPCKVVPVETTNPTDLPPFVIDFLLDTSRAALNLVYRNVTRDYPNIKWILAHSGGFLPFASNRAAGGLALLNGNPAEQDKYEAELQKFYVDIALSASATALPSTTAFFNTTQISFGSDFPYTSVNAIAQNVNGLQKFHFGNGARRHINYRNANGLFHKFLKH